MRSMAGSLGQERTNLRRTERALKERRVAALRLEAKRLEAEVAAKEDKRARAALAAEATDLEAAEAAARRVDEPQRSTGTGAGGDVAELQQDTAAMERSEELVELQTRQLKTDLLERRLALQRIEIVTERSRLSVRDEEVRTRLQMAELNSQRVPDERGIADSVRMLTDARPQVQTREARMVIDGSLEELQHATTALAQIEALKVRIEGLRRH